MKLGIVALFTLCFLLTSACDESQNSDTDTSADTDADTDTDSDTDSDSTIDSDTGADTNTGTGTDTGTEMDTDTGTEPNVHCDTFYKTCNACWNCGEQFFCTELWQACKNLSDCTGLNACQNDCDDVPVEDWLQCDKDCKKTFAQGVTPLKDLYDCVIWIGCPMNCLY